MTYAEEILLPLGFTTSEKTTGRLVLKFGVLAFTFECECGHITRSATCPLHTKFSLLVKRAKELAEARKPWQSKRDLKENLVLFLSQNGFNICHVDSVRMTENGFKILSSDFNIEIRKTDDVIFLLKNGRFILVIHQREGRKIYDEVINFLLFL